MKKYLLTAAILAAVGASPARAVLQLAAQIGPDSFFCADGQACDTSGVANVITTNNAVLDGILFTSSSSSSASGATDFLNASNLLITNTNATPVTITLTVSNTGFTSPKTVFADADSGVWQGTAGSSALFRWFIDPADAQGAANAFDTPGALVDNDLSTAVNPVLGFSRTNPLLTDSLTAPFSMTEQTVITLDAGESLVNRGQTIIGSQATVPEPSTWVMLGLGFGFLATLGLRRRRLLAVL